MPEKEVEDEIGISYRVHRMDHTDTRQREVERAEKSLVPAVR